MVIENLYNCFLNNSKSVVCITFMAFLVHFQVFMKEPERQKLQDTLHQAVIKKIILLQSLFRMVVDRRNFLRMKSAAVTIQVMLDVYSFSG